MRPSERGGDRKSPRRGRRRRVRVRDRHVARRERRRGRVRRNRRERRVEVQRELGRVAVAAQGKQTHGADAPQSAQFSALHANIVEQEPRLGRRSIFSVSKSRNATTFVKGKRSMVESMTCRQTKTAWELM